MNRKEIFTILGLSLVFLVIWFFVPEIEVSGKTTIRYDAINAYQKSWFDGMGGTIKAHYLPVEVVNQATKPDSWLKLAQTYTLFELEISEQTGPNFLMIDLPYDAMFLEDDQGLTYRLLNQELAAANQDKDLLTALTNFDWTFMNNTFPGETPTAEHVQTQGILVFEPLDEDAHSFALHIKYNMSGQKSRHINFEFERQ